MHACLLQTWRKSEGGGGGGKETHRKGEKKQDPGVASTRRKKKRKYTDRTGPTGECTSASAGDLSFTKISESGVLSGNNPGTWASDTLIGQGFASDVVIPRGLASGNYVLRHEIIALHSAANANGAQNYPQCLNVKIGSGGSSALPGGTRASGLYSSSDPGIVFNIYEAFDSYPLPGPQVWSG